MRLQSGLSWLWSSNGTGMFSDIQQQCRQCRLTTQITSQNAHCAMNEKTPALTRVQKTTPALFFCVPRDLDKIVSTTRGGTALCQVSLLRYSADK